MVGEKRSIGNVSLLYVHVICVLLFVLMLETLDDVADDTSAVASIELDSRKTGFRFGFNY